MLTYADVCRRMPTHADACRSMPTHADACLRFSIAPRRRHRLSPLSCRGCCREAINGAGTAASGGGDVTLWGGRLHRLAHAWRKTRALPLQMLLPVPLQLPRAGYVSRSARAARSLAPRRGARAWMQQAGATAATAATTATSLLQHAQRRWRRQQQQQQQSPPLVTGAYRLGI